MKLNGTNGFVKIGTTIVAEINNWAMDDSINKVTGRAFGETLETAAAGARTISGSFKGFYDPSDINGQEVFQPGALIGIDLYPDGDQSNDDYLELPEVLIESRAIDTSLDSYVTVDVKWHANAVPIKKQVL